MIYFYSFSTPNDRGKRITQTTSKAARDACPLGAYLYRKLSDGRMQYVGYRASSLHFERPLK